ncbi:MAG: ExeA family protein [Myxococcota bacterium]
MYESFFDLDELPFELTPDPRFLWLSEAHQEGLSSLYYGITRRKGFILLTGEVGTGKTTLLRAVIDSIPRDVDTGVVLNTAALSRIDLLKLIITEFQISGSFETKADYIIALNAFLLERLRNDLNTVLIIDEAQNLDKQNLEEIRLLSNLETDTQKLLQIVLTGQPELRRMMADPSLRQLRQRVAIEYNVEPLRPSEIRPYIAHRIQVAGGSYERVFSPGSESTFYSFSQGCPRLVSLLADRVLLSAFSKQIRPVPPALVEAKAKEMIAMRSQGLPENGGSQSRDG